MRFPLRLVLLMGFVIVANLPAGTVLTCGSSTGNVLPTLVADPNCYSPTNFSNFHSTDSLDWFTAYGAAAPVSGVFPVTGSSGPWMANPTADGVHVGATVFAPVPSGAIIREDNLATGTTSSPLNWVGTFGDGDHLLALEAGVLELQFDRGISGALFRISTPTTGAVYATVKAYGVMNPSAGDIPLMTYSMGATDVSLGLSSGPGGYCLGLQSGLPCNNAPYIGIETGSPNIRSLVISTNNDVSVLVDTLFLDVPAPEPSTFALTGVVGILAILGRRRKLRERRS